MFNTMVLAYGGPGTGKGTLGKYLAKQERWHQCSMSAGLREMDSAFIGLNVMQTMDKGGNVDDDIVMPTFQIMIAQYARTSENGDSLYFEGGLRSLFQVLQQLKIASAYARKVYVAKLNLDDETMISRILKGQRGRHDDAEHIVRNRVEEFRRTENRIRKRIDRAIIELNNGKIKHFPVDANQSIETVASFVLRPRTEFAA